MSCVPQAEEVTSSTEAVMRYEPLSVPPEDLSRIKAICNALEVKEERLPSLISSNYVFTYVERSCEASELSAPIELSVAINRPESNYIFRRSDGGPFAFPNVETTSSGVMSEICTNLNDLRSPMQTSSKGAIWFTTFTSTRHCISDYDSMCIHIQKGEYINDLNYRIHTNEWIKFKIRDERVGFFTERKLISSADCGAGKSIEKRVKLN